MAESQKHKATDKTRELAKTLSGLGVPQDDICHILGVTKPTLHKHYRKELDLGMAEANAKVAEGMFKQALKGNVAAGIFWLKSRAGWRETQVVQHTGADGGAVKHEHNITKDMTKEQAAALYERERKGKS